MKRCLPYQTKSGFTLLELLVVIAIISLLVAMSAAGVRRALMAGRRTTCIANMRQIGSAVQRYAADNRGNLPPTRHSAAANEAWIFLLTPYLGDMDQIRISPADPRGEERLRLGSTSYILNDIVADPLTDPFGNLLPGSLGNIMRIPNASYTLLAVVISDDRGPGAANDHTHANSWTSFQRFLSDVEADRHRLGNRHPERIEGNAPYLMVDGSVRVFDAAFIRDRFDAGVNIAQPGKAP